MTERQRLFEAIDDLEAAFRRSAGLANHEFESNRKEAIDLRRTIAEKMASLSAVAEIAFVESDRHNAFRSKFSRMRSTMAYHHASWPVISINLDDPDYLASVRNLRESNAHFIEWVRSQIAAMR